MGGPVSLRTSARLPGKVLGVVAVDTLHDAEFEFDEEGLEGFMKAFEDDFVGTCEQFVGQMIPEEGAEAVLAHVKEAGCNAGNSAVGIALMHSYAAIDIPGWFREAGVPIRAINAAQPYETRIDINRKYADFDAVLMENVGHYPHMTRPDDFNKLFVEMIAGLVEPM
jgi:pimeloyl-ACP methyl ester carboxylesterase